MTSDWISVEEKLPEDKEEVLATVRLCDGSYVTLSGVRYNFDTSGYIDSVREANPNGIWEWAYEAGNDYWVLLRDDQKVTHWMPLPDPA